MHRIEEGHERITGPYLGYYVAAYSVSTDEGHLGFAKICPDPPADVWTCSPSDKLGIGPRASPHDALGDVELKARLFLRLLHQYHME